MCDPEHKTAARDNQNISRKSRWKTRLHFTLVEPQEPGNIGAAARALKNMGYRRLDLVNPADPFAKEARWMACHGIDVLESASIYESLSEALKDSGMVVGLTRRRSKNRGLFLTFQEGIEKIVATAENNRVTILFGRENDGLTNQELAACAFLLMIPADSMFPTLNLAQSVLLTAYELNRARSDIMSHIPKLSNQGETADLYTRIHGILQSLDYFSRGDRELGKEIHRNLIRLFNRAGLTEWELNMLLGLCSRLEKKLDTPEDSK